ncbi:WhiB family transcription factor [Mycobacterium phage Mufasa]|uniref:WhiB family transcription factor n=1 Tax=Mycobacterium phage Mufasa TaxID=1718600 RepID=A0A0M5M565_9CAUD|nr:WhiB family transcription factor [Mycobacterium phage Mufasa]ALF00488.1 WhiB family transcription factor [Mycobacterium phage Mufasa]
MHMHMGGDPSAICAQTDPELWFPDKGQSTRDAKRMCMRCPLLDECRALALADRSLKGVWGGLSDRDRQRIRRQEVSA